MLIGSFHPLGATATIAASTASANGEIGTGGDAIRVFNSTVNIGFFRTSSAGTTATAADIPIAPNSVEVFRIPQDHDNFAVILAAGAGNVYVTRGQGI